MTSQNTEETDPSGPRRDIAGCPFATFLPLEGWDRCGDPPLPGDHYCEMHREIMDKGYRQQGDDSDR